MATLFKRGKTLGEKLMDLITAKKEGKISDAEYQMEVQKAKMNPEQRLLDAIFKKDPMFYKEWSEEWTKDIRLAATQTMEFIDAINETDEISDNSRQRYRELVEKEVLDMVSKILSHLKSGG